ncbi:sugar porter family MFS transporter [Lacihabitans sp. CS3-21]|jgi:MFS transporter, SP family, galactose:H+ symporter|uniref:sugar porter family MFS transporter n=1 Tax=Lacihabitans sp. CS3-21 TaxID=2487332 RepID=UPI0020CC42A0|nr:sugar porter family MFS transporter [Lacihabitans sp. CS3-21]MCP9747589.1 sugar porter family MFS transporter [Lacihabitans sp. CS3-21]
MNKNTIIYFIAAVAATGGLLFGFDTGVINVALPSLREQLQLTPSQESMVVGAVLFGAMFGPFISGFLTDKLGRKKINIIASLVFVVGSILAAIAPDTNSLIAGRLLLGLAIGIVAATVPLYLAELSPKDKRGRMVTFFQLAITLGILLSYVVGYIFGEAENAWRMMFWAGFVPAIILFVGMLLVPESPRWLLTKGRNEEALKVLNQLRTPDEAVAEYNETLKLLEEEKQNKSSWMELFMPKLRIPLFIGIGIFAIQQFSGINAIIYYSTDIFKSLFSDSQATLATVGVGIVNSLATILGMQFLDKWGRKPLLFTGLIGTAVCLGTVGLAFLFESSLPAGLRQMMLVGGIYTYIIFFAISLGPLGWLLISEVYPLKIRGFASSMGSFNHWFFDLMVAISFPLMRATSLGKNGGIFFIYMIVVLLGLFFAKFVVFETKGLSLEDIEKKYN